MYRTYQEDGRALKEPGNTSLEEESNVNGERCMRDYCLGPQPLPRSGVKSGTSISFCHIAGTDTTSATMCFKDSACNLNIQVTLRHSQICLAEAELLHKPYNMGAMTVYQPVC
jgi:hypothetical protein